MLLRGLCTTFALVAAAQAAAVTYVANITVGNISPDGPVATRQRQAWLINGKTPGPPLIANQGDSITVVVINNGIEPITVHFHGIEQIGTMWSDGVPGITQYPIKVGHTFNYTWNADKPGAAWFHSHYKMQVDDGLRAPIYIKPTTPAASYSTISTIATDVTAMKTAEVNPFQLFVYDYKKYSSDYYMQQWQTYHIDPLCIDSILINGKGQVVCPGHAVMDPLIGPLGNVTDKGCASPTSPVLFPFAGGNSTGMNPDIFFNCNATSAPLEVFVVQQSQKYAAFNLLNAGSVWDIKVSIDSHKMWVFAADGGYVVPQQVDTINIPIGERYQFFVKLDQAVADYPIRVASAAVPQMITGYGVLHYTAGNTTAPTITTIPATQGTPKVDYAGNTINGGVDLVPALLAPFPASPPPTGAAGVTLQLAVSRPTEFDWILNQQPWVTLPDTYQPVLFNASQVSLMPSNVYANIPLNATVDVIITVTAGNPALHPPHPIHKHGRKAWFLGSGSGAFPYATIAAAKAANYTGINLVNPPLRDDFLTPLDVSGTAWVAFRFTASEAAPFLMHCHIDPHLASGMVYLFNVGASSYPTIPTYYKTFTG